MGDFETTVYQGQDHTEVWASASVELYTDDVKIFHSIDEQFQYFKSLNSNIICYYHNLKFDGAFWLDYLLVQQGFTQALYTNEETGEPLNFAKKWDMKQNTVAYSISNMGMWYKILIRVNGYYIELRDSLKLLPFSVARIGQSFQTKHKKLYMEYKGFRYAGCNITDEEKHYIANDVLVVKEAFNIDTSLFVLILSLLMLVVSYVFLGKYDTVKAVLGTMLLPVFMKFSGVYYGIFNLEISSMFMVVFVGGLLMGLGNGMIIRSGYNVGGFQILYFHFPVVVSEDGTGWTFRSRQCPQLRSVYP